MQPRDADIEDVERWFGQRRFRLDFHSGDGYVWADLVRGRWIFRRVVRRYGRGTDRVSAARSAMRRWQDEQ
jgi:hypothetical protein